MKCGDVEWTGVIYVKWFCFEVMWSELKWGTLKFLGTKYLSADKSLARRERKQTTATEDFELHISYL